MTGHILDDLRYTSAHDIKMRLVGTIVRFNDKPVFVDRALEENRVKLIPLEKLGKAASSDIIIAHSSDDRLDISSPPLGWFNESGNNYCYYLMRTPRRSQRQGVVLQNITAMAVSTGVTFNEGIFVESNNDYKRINDMMLGVYPSFTSVLKTLGTCNEKKKTYKCRAFSRDWAMVQRPGFHGVYHKSAAVALFYPDKNRFTFKKGALTKTRMSSLRDLLYPNEKGIIYDIHEQP